jgi:hypothetical protein
MIVQFQSRILVFIQWAIQDLTFNRGARGEEAKALKQEAGFKARRWVVERTHRWMNRFRRILIRWDKKVRNYLSFLHVACAYITYKQSGLPGQALSLLDKLARILIIRADTSLTSKSTGKSVRGSDEPTHYSGTAPGEAKFMPHRKDRGLTRLARQRSACNSLDFARSIFCCDCGMGCHYPVRNWCPVLKVGR